MFFDFLKILIFFVVLYAAGGCCHSGGGEIWEKPPSRQQPPAATAPGEQYQPWRRGIWGKPPLRQQPPAATAPGEQYQPWRREIWGKPPLRQQPPAATAPANSAAMEAGDLGKASFTATATSRHCPGKQCQPGVAVLPCQVKPFPERLAVGVEGVGALVGGLTQAGLRLEKFCYCHHPCLVVALDPAE